MYATEMRMCNFWRKGRTIDRLLWRKVNLFLKELYLYSRKALVREQNFLCREHHLMSITTECRFNDQDTGFFVRVQRVSYLSFLLRSSQDCIEYRVVLDLVITESYCMYHTFSVFLSTIFEIITHIFVTILSVSCVLKKLPFINRSVSTENPIPPLLTSPS